MKTFIIFAAIVCAVATGKAGAQDPGNPGGYFMGYLNTIKGDDFTYHSPQPNVSTSMLVRSIERSLYIEWETEPLPTGFNQKEARFIMMAAIDVNRENPHSWDIYINGVNEFTIKSPYDDSNKKYSWKSSNGYSLEFNATLTDQHGDQHGYLILSVPERKYERGKSLRIRVEGESANSPTWFMVFKYSMKPELKLVEEQAITRESGKQYQQVRIEYIFMGDSVNVTVASGDIKTNTTLDFGYNTIRVKLPVVTAPESFQVTISLSRGKQVLAKNNFILFPVVPRTIHLLHHSHVDIGYTHVQDEVKEIQWQNLESAIKLAGESQSMPAEARFRWNSEVMWPVESYLREKEPEKAIKLMDAISNGWIELDAFYANELTELCTSEELIKLTSDARRIASECGITPLSAMITDIPGWSWGIVPVLAQSGVKYLSLGTNTGHRIGGTIAEWGDRPFYWVSPSGEERILCWIHEKAYSLFHTGLKYSELKYRLDEGKIFGYINELYENNYPYEIIPLRYNIGSDNGPTDPTLSQAVKDWNEKYITPVVKIMTVSESFAEFEEKHGDQIPSVSGAFTGYWEDGAASSALETGLNRKAASNINCAGALMVINENKGYDGSKINEAWRNVLLFDEHTWGSWNSISEPENPFTLSQWETKRTFALDALKESNELLLDASHLKTPDLSSCIKRIEIVNPHSWTVSDMVSLPASWNIAGTRVTDMKGTVIPSQKLSTGQLVFVAENVPALGSKIYILSEEAHAATLFDRSSAVIGNEDFELTVDKTTGAIASFIFREKNIDLVDRSAIPGLNAYYYVAGRSPLEKISATLSKLEITDDGPVTKIIKVTSTASGVKSLTSQYQLINGLGKLVIYTVPDKEKVYSPEGLHLGFPFKVPEGVMHIDLAYGIYRPDADQLKAANKNYFTPEKWLDISNQDYGLTWITNDAPLIEIGDISTDATAYGWISNLKPSTTFYSYIMNNYWETNYKASQEGPVSFRYTVYPHGMFLAHEAEKNAAIENEPLLVIPVDETVKEKSSLLTIKGNKIIVTSLIPNPDGYLVRLFNAGGSPEVLDISLRDKPTEIYFSDFDGNKTEAFRNGIILPAWSIRTIRVRR